MLLEGELQRIWERDLFGRRAEADMLQAYIESASVRAVGREDQSGFTLAVDAGYGEGKSFFLRRFAQHLSGTHPVAFVDAWADDLVDEPLTALASTLRRALDPLIETSPTVSQKWHAVLEKTGRVASIAAKGLAKRGLGLVFTSAAVEAADELLSGVGDKAEAAIQDDLKKSGADVVRAAAASTVAPGDLMASRIAAFEEGKAAINALKESLSALVAALAEQSLHAPIVVIIDELDRCRPTYAVKLLEEIKHLFDVPGLVFVFGMHGDQLAHSVTGAYGPGFDGRAYLRRFVSREYRLKTPQMTPLVGHLMQKFGLNASRLRFEPVATSDRTWATLTASEMIARYLKLYQVTPRDTYAVMDMIQTCLALTRRSLLMAYLMPLIIGRVRGSAERGVPEPNGSERFNYVVDAAGFREVQRVDVLNLANQLSTAAGQQTATLVDQVNRGGNVGASLVLQILREPADPADDLSLPARYPQLLDTVGRFSNPELGGPGVGKALSDP